MSALDMAMDLSQVDLVRWKLLRENDRHRVVGTAMYFKISTSEAFRRLVYDFDGDVTRFERAAVIHLDRREDNA